MNITKKGWLHMNNMTLEKIKNVLFNEIDLSFANDKLIIKL